MVSREEFLAGLRQMAVLPPAELQRLSSDLPADADETHVSRLSRQLVDDGRLTAYQRERLLEGQSRELCLGDYLLLEPIGKGGMGQVFLALHRHMHRRVALKRLRAEVAEQDEVVRRFQREIKTIAQLSHPNVVAAYDAGEEHGMFYLVMEYVEGETLHELVKRDGPRPIAEAVDQVAQAARGLRTIHAAGIIHRDIKPSNLLRDRHGTVKILDLGLARIAGPARGIAADRLVDSLTRSDQVVGTVDYMAPEQADGGGAVDQRVDLYSLGCCLYYLLTGRPVYQRSSWLDCLLAHREGPVPSLSSARPEVPASLDQLFQRLVAKQPGDRPGSADELLDALAPYLRNDGEQEPTDNHTVSECVVVPYVPMVNVPRGKRASRVRGRQWLAAMVVVGLVAVALGWRWWPGSNRERIAESHSPATVSRLDPSLSLAGHSNTIECLVFLPDGERIVSSDDDQRLLVWDLKAGKLEHQLAKGNDTGPALALDPTGKLLATAADNDLLKLWDLTTRQEIARLKGHHVAFSPVGHLLAAATQDDSIALYDTNTRESTGVLIGHEAWIFALAFSSDGKTIVSGDQYGALRIWDVQRQTQRMVVGDDVQINSLAVQPGGKLVAANSFDGAIRLWDLTSYRLAATWPTHEGAGWGLAFSSDGRWLASAGADGKIVVWDMSARRQRLAWHAHNGEAVSVAFSPDDKQLASGGDDLTVKLWDVARFLSEQ